MAVVVAGSIAVACQKPAPTENPEIVDLQARVAMLEGAGRKVPPPPATSALAPARAGYDLVVTWPSSPASNYQRAYGDAETCAVARKAVLDENDRAEAVNQAQVGKNGVVAVGSIAKASVVCIPG